MTTTKARSLYAFAINTNREQLSKANAAGQPAWVSAQERHLAAWIHPARGMESATVAAIKAWLEYGDAAAENWGETPIGEDGYAGAYWQRWGLELRGLLSCDFGRNLDGGTLDTIILGAMQAAGCDMGGLL